MSSWFGSGRFITTGEERRFAKFDLRKQCECSAPNPRKNDKRCTTCGRRRADLNPWFTQKKARKEQGGGK